MHSSVLAVDIGLAEIRIIQVNKRANSIELVNCFRHQLSGGEDDISSAIKQIITENKIRADVVIAGISSQRAIFRDLSLPFQDLAKIAKVVKYEVEPSLPYPAEEAVFAFQVHQGKSNGSSDLFIASVSKEVVASCCRSLNEAGVDPHYILLDCIALYNLAVQSFPSCQDVIALIDINEERILLTIVQGDQLLFVRNISHPNRRLWPEESDQKETGGAEYEAEAGYVESIAQGDKGEQTMTSDEAQPENGADNLPAQSAETSGFSKQVLDQILDQIDLTLYAFSSQHGVDDSISRILLTGSIATVEGISEYFTDRLQIETSIFDPLLGMTGEENPSFQNQGLLWAVPLGLALGVRKDRRSRFNLRQEELAFQKKYSQYKEMAIVLAGLLILAISLLTLNIYYRTTVQQAKLNQINQEIRQVYQQMFPSAKSSAGDELAQAKKAIEVEREKYKIYKAFTHKSLTHLEILRDLSIYIPEEIKVELFDLSIDKNQVKIKGVADSFEAVDRLKSSLQKTRQYAQSVVESAKVKGADNKVDFRLSITISDS